MLWILVVAMVDHVKGECPSVVTNQGVVKGFRDGGNTFYLGIPYGMVDRDNPFGMAQPYPKFELPYEAFKDPPACPQMSKGEVIGNLDCLRLNIFAPNRASILNKLPVIVWLYGGAFSNGYTKRYNYGAGKLIKHDIIVVTLNYRLGPYGFMCLDTPQVPGNQGIKDQLLAMKWVKSNIEFFGGDADNITLMGESAGAASVEAHLLSEGEKLFHRVILQSGSLLKPGNIVDSNRDVPLKLSRELGFKTDNASEAIAFLAKADPRTVIQASTKLSIDFKLCIEKEFDNVDRILTDRPYNLEIPKIKGIKVLAGFNSREGLVINAANPSGYIDNINFFRDALTTIFDYDQEFDSMESLVRNFYIGDANLTEQVRSDIIEFQSDFFYNFPLQWCLERFLENGAGDVYQYMFSYEGGLNYIKNFRNISLGGACHGDELGYLFEMDEDETPSAEDQKVTDRITTLWANFAKYGDVRMWTPWIILLVLGLTQGQLRLDPLVNTKQGLIRGLSASDGDYSMFLGIPYAKVDKDNPFGISTMYPAFDGVFEANNDSVVCPQIDSSTNTFTGELDCLNLNIFVPNVATAQNRLPVLIWIHGGRLANGSGNRQRYGPKFLVRHNVILVTMNYRLGPYGFLCLDIPEVPGNQGIKDQALAMRWVKDNIAEFGGDVNSITVMGESAGASSIDYHLYSNNEALFNRAILQSGSVFTAWSFSDANTSAPSKIAEHLGFQTDDVYEALNFLKDIDPKLVIEATSELDTTFRVCAERQFEGVESFLTDRPVNLDLPKVRNMQILSGFNSREQMYEYHDTPAGYYEHLDVFYDSLKIGFVYDDELEAMEDIVRHFYIGDEDVSEAVRDQLTDFRSDIDENYPIQKSMKKFLENGAQKVFHYVFSYDGGRNFAKNNYNMTYQGAAHADDIGYLFDYYDKTTPSAEDQRIIDQMTTLWTNFAKFGDPTPDTTELLPVKWMPMTLDTYHYLDIDNELAMKKRAFNDRMSFWELFFKANEKKLKGYRGN